MTSYKNDIQIKKMILTEVGKHRKQDKIIQGTYGTSGKDFKGCAVGCAINSLNMKMGKTYATDDHKAYEIELGIPEWLALLEDTLFEGLPVKESKLWPEKFLKAIPVGVDLNPIKWKFCAFILKENIERVLSLTIADELKKQVVDAIRQCLAVQEKAIETGLWDESAAESAESASRSAAWSAAWSAESASRSAAWSALWSAAESAARSAAWSAARSAAESALWSAARSAAYKKYATYLLKLLKECK